MSEVVAKRYSAKKLPRKFRKIHRVTSGIKYLRMDQAKFVEDRF